MLLLAVPVTGLAACKSKSHECPVVTAKEIVYDAFVVDYSDSIPGANHAVELTAWQQEKHVDNTAEQTITATINNQSVTGVYAYTDKDFPNNYDTRIYYNESNLQFGLDEHNRLQFYFWGEDAIDPESTESCTEEECLTIAKEFIRRDIDAHCAFENYVIDTVVKADRGLYEFTFTRHIHGFPTTDQAIVTVHRSGALYSFSSFMFGRISELNYIDFDTKSSQLIITKKLDAIYQNVKQENTSVVYGEPKGYYTILDNGDTALYCTVDVTFAKTENGFTSELNERVGMIITFSPMPTSTVVPPLTIPQK